MELLARRIDNYSLYNSSNNYPRFPSEGELWEGINYRVNYINRNYLYNIADIVQGKYRYYG